MPIPAPILPDQLLWGHRVGIERVALRMTSAAATEVVGAIVSGPKRVRWVNVYKSAASDPGINATLRAGFANVAGTAEVEIWANQAVPTSGNPSSGVQLAPTPGQAGADNISEVYPIFFVEMDNPDTDSMDLMFELVYTMPIDAENQALNGEASVAKMSFT